jgi:hypothetical protein
MLAEYRAMGEQLYPGQSDNVCLRDARSFCQWLGRLANRKPGDKKTSLRYQGRYLNVAVMFVAIRGRIEAEGLGPYRRRAKQLIYRDKVNALYLMGRDDNIPAVKELRDVLRTDALVEEVATYEYRLRSDFKARILNRERAICIVLRRRQVDEPPPPDDEADLVEAEGAYEDLEVFDYELGVIEVEPDSDREAEPVTARQ